MFMNKLFNIAEIKFGEKIIDLGSSKRFSLEIYYKTNKVISYNTIRRIYGVVSKHSLKNRKSYNMTQINESFDLGHICLKTMKYNNFLY